MITHQLIAEIKTQDSLGEGINWRASDQTVWWTDIDGKTLHCLTWPDQKLTDYPMPERLCSFGFIEGDDTQFVCAFETGFALYWPKTGEINWLDRPPGLSPGIRLNDGRVDPFGYFWAGSMREDEKHSDEPSGVLYRLGENGTAQPCLGKIGICNALCWSPDGTRMYFADSRKATIYHAPFDTASGVPGRFKPFVRISDGAPDGAVTDADRNIWVAIWGPGRVECYSPAGERLSSIETGAPFTTCPAFGGPDMNLLFVTTSRDGQTGAKNPATLRSGSMLVFETGTKGVSTTRANINTIEGREIHGTKMIKKYKRPDSALI